ncbi:MAG TPA: helical backbone metal receptor [Acidimicrobiales bacterium]|nr:helical backbone metal receptor [Acidimicrobiales bacterium]
MRVVSLVPSVTETLLAWGVVPVACTRFCEQPDLLHVGGTKDPDIDAIVGLAPDLVVMDEEENRRDDADALALAGVPVHVTAVRSLGDVAPTLDALAAAAGAEARDRVTAAVPSAPSPGGAGPNPGGARRITAFVPIWRRPWMTIGAGTYASSLLDSIGVANVYGDAGERYPTVTLEDAAARRPDVVLAPSEPYPFGERHVPELERVAPVRLVDGRDVFWWGIRTGEARARLAEAVGSS